MNKFDEFASDDIDELVRQLTPTEGKLTLLEGDPSGDHAVWVITLADASVRMVRDYWHWTLTLAFPGTDRYPVAWWEHALKGNPVVPTKLDVTKEIAFLKSNMTDLVVASKSDLNNRLELMKHEYRTKMLG